MKTLITILLLLFSGCLLGQSVAKATFSSGGGNLSNGTETISFTFGEPIIDFVGSGPSIDQGFWASVAIEAILGAGIGPYQHLEIVAYPNPMDDHFYIRTNSVSETKIDIYNILGQQIRSEILPATLEATKIDSSLLSSGVYLVSVSIIDNDFKKNIKLLKN